MIMSPFNFLQNKNSVTYLSNSYTGNIVKLTEDKLISNIKKGVIDETDSNISILKEMGYIVDEEKKST